MIDNWDSKDRQTITFNKKDCPNCKKGELLENSSMNGKSKWLQCNNCENIFKLKKKTKHNLINIGSVTIMELIKNDKINKI